MKICIVHNLFPLGSEGGSEAVVRQSIDLLHAAGHEVVLITTQASRESKSLWTHEYRGPLKMYRFRPHLVYQNTESYRQPVWKKMLWHILDAVNIYDAQIVEKILKKERPNLVHGHNLKGMSTLLPIVCNRLNIPYVHTLHGYQLLHPYGTFQHFEQPPFFKPKIFAVAYQAWHRKVFQKTTGVISPSDLPLTIHQEVGFFQKCQTTILPSSIPLPQTQHTKSTNPVLRFVYFGAIEDSKGIRILLDAIHAIPSNNFTLDIYGNGSLLQNLRQLNTAQKNIQWHGFSHSTEVLSAYDALIYPSTCYETQGLSMAEALVRGIPVLAARIGSIPEMIHEGVNGYLFRSGDAQALADLLQRIIMKPDSIRKLQDFAKTSQEKFDPKFYTQRLLAFYKDCLSTRKIQ